VSSCGRPPNAKTAGCQWLHVDFEPHLARFSTPAGFSGPTLVSSICRQVELPDSTPKQRGINARLAARNGIGIRVEAGTCGIPQAKRRSFAARMARWPIPAPGPRAVPATSPEAIAPPASDNLGGLSGTLIHPIEPWKRDHVAGREAPTTLDHATFRTRRLLRGRASRVIRVVLPVARSIPHDALVAAGVLQRGYSFWRGLPPGL
jgi:hypothetical protein